MPALTPNPGDIVREILSRHPAPPSPPRSRHGQWVPYAEAAQALVSEHAWSVTDAVRHVVAVSKPIVSNPRAFRCIRAAVYALRQKQANQP